LAARITARYGDFVPNVNESESTHESLQTAEVSTTD
jgi:hypothetical protein